MSEKLFSRHINKKIPDESIISFDVFDTLVTRTVPPPEIINALGKRLLELLGEDISLQSFQKVIELRSTAWTKLLKERQSANGFFEDALSEDMIELWVGLVADYLNLPNQDQHKISKEIIELEIRLEIWAAQPLKTALIDLKSLKTRGYRLIYISDMYLSKQTIDAILNKCGYEGIFENGFVSSELGLLKRTGNLFKHLIESERITPLYHFGDNKLADRDMPRLYGIESFEVKSREMKKKVKQASKLWDKAIRNPELLSFSMASIIQKNSHSTNHKPDPWSYSMALFSLSTAIMIENRHETVMCPAREGLSLLSFLDEFNFIRIAEHRCYTMTTRKSVSPMAYLANPSAFVDKMIEDNPETTWIEVMRKMGIADRNSLELAKKYHLSYMSVPLLRNYNDTKWRLILADRQFYASWFENVDAKIREVSNFISMNYVNKSSNDLIFVDLGWAGTIQENLVHALDSQQKLYGIYYGLNDKAFDLSSSQSSFTSLICHQNSDFFSHFIFTCPNLLEIFLLAPHASPEKISESISISELHGWIRDNPAEITKMEYQKNALSVIKDLELGYLLFRPSLDNIAQLARTYHSKMILYPHKRFLNHVLSMATEFGFEEKKYQIIQTSASRILNLRRSIWRYGAAKMNFGQFFASVLIIRDSLRWGLPGVRNIPIKNKLYRSELNSAVSIEHDKTLPNLSQEFSKYLQSEIKITNIASDPLTNKDIFKLRAVYFFANVLRKINRKVNFENLTLPTRKIVLNRVLR